ncbi:MAG: hypothetical protein ACRC18_06590 [Cetobacterium sp.]
MNKLYFAKDKVTQELYYGMKSQSGFIKLGNLKSSISYKYKYYRSTKTCDDFDFYCLDTNTMKIERVGE